MKEKFMRFRTSVVEAIRRLMPRRQPGPLIEKSRLLIVGDFFRRHWTVVIGLVAAGVAFIATQHYAENRVIAERDRLLPRGGLVEVLVASRDLSVGDQASPVTVAIRRVPREWLLPNTLTPQDFDAVADQSLVMSVTAGSPILLDHLRKVDRQQTGFQLEHGFRAVSISVDEVSSVGGLIQPGDYVDLWGSPLPKTGRKQDAMVTLGADSSNTAQQVRLIAENLRVLATGQTTLRRDAIAGPVGAGQGSPLYSSITLAVPSRIANLVLGGQFQGRLGIALRSSTEEVSSSRSKRAAKSSKAIQPPVEILIGGVEGVEE
jgi:pilus assembly protein CpaB